MKVFPRRAWVHGVVGLLALGLPALAQAGMISGTGATAIIPAPSDVSNGSKESDTQVFAFPEQQNITLNTSLSVDISVPGSVPASSSNNNLSPLAITAGTKVSSYYLHFDTVGVSSSPIELIGSLTFDSDILGLMITGTTLNATAAFPGLAATSYSTNGALEINTTAAFDSIVLSADRRTLTFDLRDANAPDDIRIITVAVPEPASLSILALSGVAILIRRRR